MAWLGSSLVFLILISHYACMLRALQPKTQLHASQMRSDHSAWKQAVGTCLLLRFCRLAVAGRSDVGPPAAAVSAWLAGGIGSCMPVNALGNESDCTASAAHAGWGTCGSLALATIQMKCWAMRWRCSVRLQTFSLAFQSSLSIALSAASEHSN